MKVSFPHMGCVTGYKRLLEKLGHEVIMPQRPTQKTMELGVKYSPEFICFPFKVMMGTYIECAEAGAELIITSGGSGPCRAGMYPDVHQKVLEELGYSTKVIVFDSIFADFGAFCGKLKAVLNGTSMAKVLPLVRFSFHLIRKMDQLEKELKIRRAYEENIGDFTRAWRKIVRMFEKCDTCKDVDRTYEEARAMFDAIEVRTVKDEDRIRVGIVGEIYVVMEPSVNKNVEEILNNLGIEVENVQYISDWLLFNLMPKWLPYPKSHRVFRRSDHISPINCGGHDKENMGWVYDFSDRGFDGIVHLMPFACLPELVNLGKFPAVSEELNLPILSLSLDEQMGEAHVKTRLEAFTDLIRSKHNAKKMAKTPAQNASAKPERVAQEASL
ncbi:MAG: hypothetical protein U0L92_03195 [Clostridia bacterium]|nr:hypothetical protein [Clostridia bacterium]